MQDISVLHDELHNAQQRLSRTIEPVAMHYIQNEIKTIRREIETAQTGKKGDHTCTESA